MRAIYKLILFCLLFTSFLISTNVCVNSDNTLSYYSDVEPSNENTLTVAIWGEGGLLSFADNSPADDTISSFSEPNELTISNSTITQKIEDDKKLSGFTFNISGTKNATIDQIQVWWNNSQVNNSHITEITIQEKQFFKGSKVAGDIIDGTDYLLEKNSPARTELYFDSNVSDLSPFTVNITTSEGFTKSFVTNPE